MANGVRKAVGIVLLFNKTRQKARERAEARKELDGLKHQRSKQIEIWDRLVAKSNILGQELPISSLNSTTEVFAVAPGLCVRLMVLSFGKEPGYQTVMLLSATPDSALDRQKNTWRFEVNTDGITRFISSRFGTFDSVRFFAAPKTRFFRSPSEPDQIPSELMVALHGSERSFGETCVLSTGGLSLYGESVDNSENSYWIASGKKLVVKDSGEFKKRLVNRFSWGDFRVAHRGAELENLSQLRFGR